MLPPPILVFQIVFFKRYGRWSCDSAKDGYVKDSLFSRLSISQALGLEFYFFLVLPGGPLKMEYSRKEFRKLTFRALALIRSDKGVTLETSAFESLYGGQFKLSTQLIKPQSFKLLALQHY